MFTADIKKQKDNPNVFRRQGKVAGMGMEIINYKYNDSQLVADKDIDEVLERTWSRLDSNVAQNEQFTIR